MADRIPVVVTLTPTQVELLDLLGKSLDRHVSEHLESLGRDVVASYLLQCALHYFSAGEGGLGMFEAPEVREFVKAHADELKPLEELPLEPWTLESLGFDE